MIRIASAWVMFALAAAGCESPIVGGECLPGFVVCDGECVNLEADFRNCGACGNNCGRFSCSEGSCGDVPRPDAGLDAGRRDAGLRDARIDDPRDAAPPRDGGDSGPDASLEGCSLGQLDCDGACVDPATDPRHCGSCARACPSGQVCSRGRCARNCEGALQACGGRCYDLADDPNHCGGCSERCASGICENSSCADDIAGQVVVIGHDFTAANGAMRRIAGNAVFLARGAPVRVLAYQGAANAASISGVEQAIEFTRGEIGRAWEKTEAEPDRVPVQLLTADVFLIHAQADATDAALAELGRRWAAAISQFLARGGTVVLFEAPSTRNAGTYRILDSARVFAARARTEIPAQTLTVKTPGLGVALRVPDRYMSARQSVRFEAVTTEGTAIVVERDGNPVVIQRVILQ